MYKMDIHHPSVAPQTKHVNFKKHGEYDEIAWDSIGQGAKKQSFSTTF